MASQQLSSILAALQQKAKSSPPAGGQSLSAAGPPAAEARTATSVSPNLSSLMQLIGRGVGASRAAAPAAASAARGTSFPPQKPPPQRQAPAARVAPSAAPPTQHSEMPMYASDNVVALGIVDSPMAYGSWQLEERDLRSLFELFGATQWMRVLCSPLGSGKVPDCCIAKFVSQESERRMEAELDGTQLDGVGRLAVCTFSSSILDGVADEASLAAVVSSKVQAKGQWPSPGPGWSSAGGGPGEWSSRAGPSPGLRHAPSAVAESPPDAAIAAALASALGQSSAEAVLASEAGQSAVAAVRADPSLLAALQAAAASAGVPEQQRGESRALQVEARPKKRVCRLELVDLFAHHPEFDVPSLILGKDQSNIQYVLEEAKQKVDINLDGVPVNAAPVADRLHLTVSTLDEDAYGSAVSNLEDLLENVCSQYVDFLTAKKLTPIPPSLGFRRHEYVEGPDGQMVYMGQKERPRGAVWAESGTGPPPTSMRYEMFGLA